MEEYQPRSEVVEVRYRQTETIAPNVRLAAKFLSRVSYLSLLIWPSAFYPVSALYHICLEAYRSRSAV